MSKQQGAIAEQYAQEYLQRQGLILLKNNYNCRFGEIDLIMQHGEEIVFVEVRYRNSTAYGGGAASVTYHKQCKLIRTATHYLLSTRSYDKIPCRFDVIAIGHTQKQLFTVEWIPDAFQLHE